MKHDKIAYAHGAVINIYIVYKLKKGTNSSNFTLENTLLSSLKVTKDVNTSHCGYSGYGIGFDSGSSFSFGNSISAKNVIIFGCDISFSIHNNNRQKNIDALGKDFKQGVSSKSGSSRTIYAEKLYKTKITEQNKKFVLSFPYNGDNSYLFVNGVQQLKFKTKDSEIKRNPLCLGGISNRSTTNATKTGLFGNVYDFAVYYVPISNVKTIYDVHRYFMKETILCYMVRAIKKVLILVLVSVGFILTNSTKCISLKNKKCIVR